MSASSNPLAMKPDQIIAEIERYETELASILGRFRQTRGALSMAEVMIRDIGSMRAS